MIITRDDVHNFIKDNMEQLQKDSGTQWMNDIEKEQCEYFAVSVIWKWMDKIRKDGILK